VSLGDIASAMEDKISEISLDPDRAAGTKTPSTDPNLHDMAEWHDALSDEDDKPVAPARDEPTGASAPGTEQAAPVFDAAGEMHAALGRLARGDESASAGALRDSCSGV